MKQFRIVYEKPDIGKLRSEGWTCVDMHFHSVYSDGKSTAERIAERAKKLGIGICITDHNAIKGSVELAEKDVISIPGIEVTAKEGAHILFYFYRIEDLIQFYINEVEQYKVRNSHFTTVPLLELIAKGKKYDAVIIAPHPYAPTWTGIMNLIKYHTLDMSVFDQLDGVEAITGANLKKNNKNSSLLAMNVGKGITGGTDGHVLYEMGKVVTCVKKAKNGKEFLKEIVNGKSMVMGREIDIFRKATAHGIKVSGELNMTPHRMREHLRYGRNVLSNKKRSVKEKLRNGLNRIMGRKSI